MSKIFNSCLNGQNIGNRSNKIKNDKKKKTSELEKQNVKQNSLQIESQARTLKKTNTQNSLIKCYNSWEKNILKTTRVKYNKTKK